MSIILVILFLLIILLSYHKNRSVYAPAFVFAFLWLLIVFLDFLNFYGLYRSQSVTYLVIGIGVLSFAFGSLISCFFPSAKNNALHNTNSATTIRYYPFFVLLAITILMLMYPAFTNLIDVLSGKRSFFDIRDSFGNPYSSKFLQLIYNYIANPFSNAALSISAVTIVSEKNKKIRLFTLIGVIVLLLLKVLADAGRGIIIYFFVMLLFSYFIGSKEKTKTNPLSKRTRKYILFFAVVSFFLYFVITILRGANGIFSVFKQIYIYLCGCIPFLDYQLAQIMENGVCLFGAGGLHGPLEFVFTMIENVGVMDYPPLMVSSDFWYDSALATIQIGDSTVFNAYATLFYNVFLDGGFIALIIEMFFYGLLCGLLFQRLKNNRNNLRVKAIYLYVLYGLVFSFVRFQLSLSSHFLAFIMIALLFKGNKHIYYESASNKRCISEW